MEESVKIAGEDERAFALLYDRYRDRVYNVAFKLTGSAYMSGEIVQEVFMKIWIRRDQLTGIENLESYLFIMARNCVFTALKQIARRQEIETDWQAAVELTGNEVDSDFLSREYNEIHKKAIDTLPAQQKQVYILSKEDELSRNEIADLLKISPETVKTHLTRAVKAIRSYCAVRISIGISIIASIWQN